MTRSEAESEIREWVDGVLPKFLDHMEKHRGGSLSGISDISIISDSHDFTDDVLFECAECDTEEDQ